MEKWNFEKIFLGKLGGKRDKMIIGKDYLELWFSCEKRGRDERRKRNKFK